MTLIHSDAAVRSRSVNISNFGLAAFAAGSVVSFGMGAITHNEHARETGILTAEAMADSFLVSEALKLAIQRERPGIDGSQGLGLATGISQFVLSIAARRAGVVGRGRIRPRVPRNYQPSGVPTD